MERRLHQIYRDNHCQPANLKVRLLILSTPVVLWPGAFSQDLPDWLLFGLPVSLILAIIIALFAGILILLFILWRRSKQQVSDRPELFPPPGAVDQTQQKVPIGIADTGELPSARAGLQPGPYETIPVGTVTIGDIETSPRMPEPMVIAEPQTTPISGQRPANIGWQIASLTDVGLKRDHNEDSLLMMETVMGEAMPCGLYVVADGLGGHQGGEIASRLTIDTINEHFTRYSPTAAKNSFEDWLKRVVLAANHAVLSRQEDQSQAKKMGSTLVMALVTAGQAHIANVGDSRAYHLNRQGIRQISVDHSLVQRLVQIGQLTPEEARTHKNKNVIYNTIGDKPNPEIGFYRVPLQPGDRLLLCSDGLSDMVTDQEILEISQSQADPAETCKALIKQANLAGGNDNITVIIIQMGV